MKIKFYLKRPLPGSKASDDVKRKYNVTSTSIYALINYDGNSIKVYTSESINPKFWNSSTQCARISPKFPESPEFNQRLNNIRSTISKVFLDFRNSNQHESPSPAILKPLIEAALKKKVIKFTFIEYFEDFVKRTFSGQRYDPRSGKPIRRGVAKQYQSTLNTVREFNKYWKKQVDFDTIDLEFHSDFTKWLSESPRLRSLNTIGSHIQRIKAVLAEATEKGINKNISFKSRHFIKSSEDADTIYLNPAELNEMQNLDLSGNPTLECVRDLFLIGAYTGLRYSDFTVLQPGQIKDGFIRIIQTKTGAPVTIPVHPQVKKILDKYDGQIPKAYTNQRMNLYLKDISKMMKSLQIEVEKGITKGGLRVIKKFKKWELLTTHAARRSFATNEYNAGTPPLTIRAITGHKTEVSFLKYLRINQEDHAKKIKELWEKRYSPGKVVGMKQTV